MRKERKRERRGRTVHIFVSLAVAAAVAGTDEIRLPSGKATLLMNGHASRARARESEFWPVLVLVPACTRETRETHRETHRVANEKIKVGKRRKKKKKKTRKKTETKF